MAALGWNMCLSKLPAEITDDYNQAITKAGVPRMDIGSGKERDDITLNKLVYEDLQLAPPSAMAAMNYARYTHSETNGNTWMLAITTQAPPIAEGGDFYVASYGVLMKAATNTLSSWRPTDDHGTTLYALSPESELNREMHASGVCNRGFALEMIKRMKGPAIPQEEFLGGKKQAEEKKKRAREEENIDPAALADEDKEKGAQNGGPSKKSRRQFNTPGDQDLRTFFPVVKRD